MAQLRCDAFVEEPTKSQLKQSVSADLLAVRRFYRESRESMTVESRLKRTTFLTWK